ncbi:hypothetical protein KY312_04275, partial [Candidatus Woesearchaeota archaeon]|nr:hypothetical protein [Candidatus Woesearchaeota archaeon]
MKKGIDLYNYSRRYESAVKHVKKARISVANKKHILDFIDHCTISGIGVPRRLRYLGVLKMLAEMLKVDFNKATKEDIQRIVRLLVENEKYSAWTKSTYKTMLKR